MMADKDIRPDDATVKTEKAAIARMRAMAALALAKDQDDKAAQLNAEADLAQTLLEARVANDREAADAAAAALHEARCARRPQTGTLMDAVAPDTPTEE